MPQQTLAAGVFVGALLCGVVTAAVPPHARADVVAYLVNVTVRPGYNFANADAALSYDMASARRCLGPPLRTDHRRRQG